MKMSFSNHPWAGIGGMALLEASLEYSREQEQWGKKKRIFQYIYSKNSIDLFIEDFYFYKLRMTFGSISSLHSVCLRIFKGTVWSTVAELLHQLFRK